MRTAPYFLAAVCLAVAAGPAAADDQAEMKALLDRATRALGGAKNLTRYQGMTVRGKGTIRAGDMNIPFTETSYWRLPEMYRFDLELTVADMKLTETIVLNGAKGWVKLGPNTAGLPKNALTAYRDVFHGIRLAMRPLDAKGKGFKLSPLGEVRIDDRPAAGVRITRKGRADVNLYLDKKTGLPVKAEVRSQDDMAANQEVNHEILFQGYKKFGDLQTFTKVIWKKNGKTYVVQEFSDITPEEELDADYFDKP